MSGLLHEPQVFASRAFCRIDYGLQVRYTERFADIIAHFQNIQTDTLAEEAHKCTLSFITGL